MLREAPQSDPMTFLSTTPHHFAEHLCTPWGWRCGANPPGSRNVAPSQQCEHIVEDLTFVATRIYHVPVWASYAKTRIDTAKGERWFCSEAVARRRGGDERSGDALRLHFFAGRSSSSFRHLR